MPDYGAGRSEGRHRTEDEDAVQNSHRAENNKKKGVTGEQIVFRVLREGLPCQHLMLATDRPA